MSIRTIDIIFYKFLSDSLNHIRAHPEIIDEIFGYYLEEPYEIEFGQKTVDQIKKWFLENDLPVVLAWELTATSFPCYSLHLAESSEMVESAYLSDDAGIIEEPEDPRVIVSEFVPSAYNTTTGVIIASDSIDLSIVFPGYIIKDAKNQLFEITDVTGQNITIDITGTQIPDLSKCLIQAFIDMKIFKHGETYFKDSIDIGINATLQSNMVLWMYDILLYILFRFKMELIKRGVDLTTFTASDFSRDNQYLGDNIYSRWVRVSGRTQVTWKAQEYDQADTLIANVSVDDIDNT